MARKVETLPAVVPPKALPSPETLNAIIMKGDWSLLSATEQREHYMTLCDSLGLRYLTQPFLFLDTNDGRTILYATRSCTDQLRQLYCLSSSITKREKDTSAKVYLVEVKIWDPFGREDFATGAAPLTDKDGDPLDTIGVCNAIKKAETQAKRRATLSWCGLGILDESEIEHVRARRNSVSSVLVELTKPATSDLVNRVQAVIEHQNISPADFREATGKARVEDLTVFQAQTFLSEHSLPL